MLSPVSLLELFLYFKPFGSFSKICGPVLPSPAQSHGDPENGGNRGRGLWSSVTKPAGTAHQKQGPRKLRAPIPTGLQEWSLLFAEKRVVAAGGTEAENGPQAEFAA